ncbi:putative insertion sequence transposase protein [Caenispirillum salinarum AK4]|uniref:Putative insertion sequence transposase protein n=1 Tax=Caenispirillum salinarum AK4 TaxID=1238182 RepID=K9GWY7_9PROT|nr:putative insertion sequence transposase protein [Caenispirillum salinarum AK4]
MNLKRVHRLYRLEGLQLRARAPKRKVAAKQRETRPVATAPNQVWAMDFMADQLFDGRRIRLLTIVDAYSRLCPALDVRHTYRGRRRRDAGARHGRLRRAQGDLGR